MNRVSSKRYEKDVADGRYCAGQFRRSASLRLRDIAPRSPLATRRSLAPDSPLASRRVLRPSGSVQPSHDQPDRVLRPRSHSFNSNARNFKSILKTSPDRCMDRKLSPTDSTRTPPGSPEDLLDDDSLNSYGSVATAASVDAGYAPYNGTTFSGRSMRYVLHCSSHAGLSGEDYLTPTQRAQKQIRKLKNLLSQAKRDLDKKDSEIFHLTKEVVELRLHKTSICSPDEKSNSSEAVTIRENPEDALESSSPKHDEACGGTSFDVTDGSLFKNQTPTRCRNNEMQGSFTDSGHFDDLTNSSLHSKESIQLTHDAGCMTDSIDTERHSLVEFYDKKIEDLIRNHVGETQELKKVHNDKVEALLQKLSDVNNRYSELLPNYEQAKEKIHALEKQLEEVSKQLEDEESKHRAMYLQMYNKGVEAARFEHEKGGEASSVSRVSVEELLEQLQITQSELENVRAMYRRIVESQKGNKNNVDPEVTLQFLKSAIYYFLTDPVNHQGHLNAIENILGFSETEKSNIKKARTT